jgi:hypothetical protein
VVLPEREDISQVYKSCRRVRVPRDKDRPIPFFVH